jgi:PAS domain S-box-containing protein
MVNSRYPHERLLPGSFLRRLVTLVLATLLSAGPSLISAQVNNGTQKKVLVFYLMRRGETSTLASERIYQQALTDGLGGELDYYGEYVDLARFGGSDYQSAFRDFLKRKYNGTNFDLIIANGDLRNFLARYGAEVFPNTPVVFSISNDAFDNTATPPNFTGIVYETDLRGTLDVIHRLQPAVKNVFVITGASQAVDKWHEARARKQFKEYGGQFEFAYLSGLPIDELKRRISNLTPDSVVYFVIMAEDGAGNRFSPTNALDQIAAAANVPIYTWYDGYLGHGTVGGSVESSEKKATRITELALRILRGERVETMPITRANTTRLVFDWRQLQRWKLNETRLPAEAEVLFKEATFWQRYRNRIVSVIALFTLQSALIVALLVERRRRQRASIGLKESEERYRNVVETQTELICRFLPDTTLTFVNDAYCKYFCKAAHELVGTKFVLLIPESERDSTLRYFESLVQQPRSETREHTVIRPGGSPGWQQWTNSVISSGAGAEIELQGVGRDISERKQLEQQLIGSEKEFSTLVENSPDVICRLNRDLRYIYASPNLQGIFGIATEVFLGKRPGEVAVADYDWSGFECRCREAIDKRQATVHEFRYRSRDYRTRIIPEYSSGGAVESVMSISEDVTERLRAELEVRTLTARLFSLQDEERRRIARELHDGATQNIAAITMNLGRLVKVTINPSPEITNLLDDSQQLAAQSLSELRTLSYLLHPPILDHAGLVRALQWFVRGFSERTGIHVDAVAVEDIGRLSPEIETALFRIVQESLTNVRRHSGSDTASIRLEKGSAEVKLQISDRGHGMLEGARNASAGGDAEFGVGIAGMRERLIQLGGRLEIESTDNGTTITVVVPTIQGETHSQHSGA